MRSLGTFHQTRRAAVALAAVLFAIGAAPQLFAQNANDTNSPVCPGEPGLSYLCGFVAPEDVVNVGSTGFVLASGHRPPGNMYLIDPATGTHRELIHGAAFRLQHDADAFPDCPGPLNLERFDVHGISIAETSPRRFSLYTTSHGAREAIEIYELDLSGAAPSLAWTGCVLLQQDGYFNAVAQLADGGFVATRMRDLSVRSDDVPPGEISGRVFEWHPGGALEPLAGTELSLPNGIDVSEDERYLYVAAMNTQELVIFDRNTTPMTKRSVALPMRPDNVHWDGRGQLLLAGPNPVDSALCDNPDCPAGWSVAEVNPQTLAVSLLGGADRNAALQDASAAMRVGDEIWVGSNQDRIARFTLN